MRCVRLAVVPALCLAVVFPVSALQEVRLTGQKVVALGEQTWDFYWKKLLTPADFAADEIPGGIKLKPMNIWNGQKVGGETAGSFGYGTYRLRIRVDTDTRNLAVRMPSPLTSYRVFINGVKFEEAGIVAESAEKFVPRRRSALIFFTQEGPELDIVIQVANFLHYKGGLRSGFELGRAEDMRAYGMRYLATDLFSIGLIFSIMIYHLLIYLLTRKDISTLVFAILAFFYFLLAFLFGEQSISLFLPDLPLGVHLRLGALLSYMLPPLILQFTALLFPGILHRNLIRFYWVVAMIFAVMLALPPVYFTAYNLYYFACVGVSVACFCLWGAMKAYRQGRPGALLLIGGLFFLLSLAVYATYLVTTHTLAGSYLSIGFSLFALFQSGSLAHNHAALDRSNAEMQVRIERSRQALENQRKQIEANLHDSLGGNLTDIKLGLEALAEKTSSAKARLDLRKLDHRIAGTIASLRTELLFLEDLELAMKDFISGINLILLRRYQMAGRKVDIQISGESRDRGRELEERGLLDYENKMELCLIVQELCSNTLKHGKGRTEWHITAEKRSLALRVSNAAGKRQARRGHGATTLRERASRIGAQFEEGLSGGDYTAELRLAW